MPKNCCFWTMVLEKTLESPLDCKEIQPVHPKGDQSWVFIGSTDVEAETPVLWPPQELTHWKRPWCWEGLGAGGEGDDRGWDGWMASQTRWIWVWVNSGGWWWTGRPGMLRLWGRKESDTTEQLNWTEETFVYVKDVLWTRGPHQKVLEIWSYPKKHISLFGPWQVIWERTKNKVFLAWTKCLHGCFQQDQMSFKVKESHKM